MHNRNQVVPVVRDVDETLIVHDFVGWTPEGPVIDTRRPELATVVPLLREAS